MKKIIFALAAGLFAIGAFAAETPVVAATPAKSAVVKKSEAKPATKTVERTAEKPAAK